jgi:hypothetical protein
MQIHARMCMSADGYVTTPDGWPAQLADPAFASGTSHGMLPLLLGAGMQLTPSVSPDTGLTFEGERAIPGGSVEIIYACNA